MTLDSRGVVGVANLLCWWWKKYGFAFACAAVPLPLPLCDSLYITATARGCYLRSQRQTWPAIAIAIAILVFSFFFFLFNVDEIDVIFQNCPRRVCARRLGWVGVHFDSPNSSLYDYILCLTISFFSLLSTRFKPMIYFMLCRDKLRISHFLFALHQGQTNPILTLLDYWMLLSGYMSIYVNCLKSPIAYFKGCVWSS